MSHKHTIGTPVHHSRYGAGAITEADTEIKTPPPYDPIKLVRERLSLRARLAEIERIEARGAEPYPVSVYAVTFDGGRRHSFEDEGIDALLETRARVAAEAAEPEAREAG